MRFAIVGAQETIVGNMRVRLHAGQTIADTAGNALAGDVIAPVLCASLNSRLMPLDASAASALVSAGFAGAVAGKAISHPSTGADSIS